MKKIFAILIWLTPLFGSAQNNKKIEVGFNLNQLQSNYGLGIHIISPSFAQNILSIKIGANINWLQHINNNETVWSPFGNFQVGVRSKSNIIENKIYIYGEGGIAAITPSKTISKQSVLIGGYGIFGFEFLPAANFAYFIELGGIGTGAVAENIINKPVYANGFITQVGFKVKL